MNTDALQSQIQRILQTDSSIQIQAVAGGDTHRTFRALVADGREVFAKVNRPQNAAALRSEYNSLLEIKRLQVSGYPTPLGFSNEPPLAVLLMSFHRYTGLTDQSASKLGRALAIQHRIYSDQYGWFHDNHIGLTPQPNSHLESWLSFFQNQRLVPQLERALANGLRASTAHKVDNLIDNLHCFIEDAFVKPSLLHGDLWSGNVAYDEELGQAALFDPAPYFGDREADIAMTRLFGGFSESFYRAYDEVYPLDPHWERRVGIYNTYHALNHFNLFGQPYFNLVEQCLNVNSEI